MEVNMNLNKNIIINKKTIKNRIVMPPLVCFNWADDNGFETVSRKEHYGLRAKYDTGLIVIEASAISKSCRITDTMLGIWDDAHIPQFKEIADECHQYGSVVLVQIVHAGYKSTEDKSSASKLDEYECRELTLDEIALVKKDFVDAAVRAYKSGLDGVEIHGAHQYLLNQFTATATNFRDDLYGKDLNGRLRLSLEIVEDIRRNTSEDFIIGYRFGVNDSTFKEDLYFVKELEKAGIDFLNVSAGYAKMDFNVPESFNFHPITYMGKVISEATDIPTACVYGIRTGEQAEELMSHVDMVAIGKGLLADPKWSYHALNHLEINKCLECKRCLFSIDGHKCPAKKSEV